MFRHWIPNGETNTFLSSNNEWMNLTRKVQRNINYSGNNIDDATIVMLTSQKWKKLVVQSISSRILNSLHLKFVIGFGVYTRPCVKTLKSFKRRVCTFKLFFLRKTDLEGTLLQIMTENVIYFVITWIIVYNLN